LGDSWLKRDYEALRFRCEQCPTQEVVGDDEEVDEDAAQCNACWARAANHRGPTLVIAPQAEGEDPDYDSAWLTVGGTRFLSYIFVGPDHHLEFDLQRREHTVFSCPFVLRPADLDPEYLQVIKDCCRHFAVMRTSWEAFQLRIWKQ